MQTYTQTQNEIKQITLRGIVWNKFLLFIENNTVFTISKKLMELLVGVFLGVLLLNPGIAIMAITSILQAHNFAMPKILIGFILWRSRKNWLRQAIKFFRWLKMPKMQSSQKIIDGIPIDELVDYLIRNGHFRREGINGVRATFGLPMEKFNTLAGRLEANGVLVRGENNLRILAPKWSRQALIEFLNQNANNKKSMPWFKINRIDGKIRLDRQEILTS